MSQAVYDAVSVDGAPVLASSRTWPNTERLRAWLAVFEMTGRDPRREVSASLRLLFDRYFAAAPRGAWIDRFDGEGRAIATAIPASILYHVFAAFAEVLRLEPQLKAPDR
jgi:mannose/cellobiose epimerase-like protein (N-acyl-D-glucosamine 2-epimerase family)